MHQIYLRIWVREEGQEQYQIAQVNPGALEGKMSTRQCCVPCSPAVGQSPAPWGDDPSLLLSPVLDSPA